MKQSFGCLKHGIYRAFHLWFAKVQYLSPSNLLSTPTWSWLEGNKNQCPAAFFGSYMAVSENSGIPKSSILIGVSIKDHPFFGVPLFWKHPYIFTKILGFFCRAYFLVFLRPTKPPSCMRFCQPPWFDQPPWFGFWSFLEFWRHPGDTTSWDMYVYTIYIICIFY